jgi:hypothetical protein
MNCDQEDFLASAEGIRHCLRLLAEEAASLKLRATLSAIEKALDAVLIEAGNVRATLLLH